MSAVAIIVAAAAVTLLALQEPAQARASNAPLTESAWFWNAQASGASLPGSPPVTLPDPTVPTGDLVVAGPHVNGNPQKETYLSFDTSAIPPGAIITSFVITLPVDTKGTSVFPSGMTPPIIACSPQGTWSPGPAQPPNVKPADSCSVGAPRVLSHDKNKTFSVDIGSIAAAWVAAGSLNFGVAITDDPNNTSTTYQAVFGPAASLDHLQAAVTFQPPAPSTPAVATTVPAVVTPVSPTTSGASPPPAASSAASAAPVSAPPTSSVGPALAAPTPVNTTAATAAVRVAPAGASSAPTAGFWIAAVLLVLVLLASGRALGGPPQAREIEARGVGRMLAQRLARQPETSSEVGN